MDVDTVLAACSSSEPSTFSELCAGLGDSCPDKGDKSAWRDLFQTLDNCERDGLVDIDRVGGKLESVILTDAGADRVREKLDRRRGLLSVL